MQYQAPSPPWYPYPTPRISPPRIQYQGYKGGVALRGQGYSIWWDTPDRSPGYLYTLGSYPQGNDPPSPGYLPQGTQ